MSGGGPSPTDAVLVARAREGDRAAQEALFRRHVRLVTGLVYRLRPTHADLDDIVQDTFIAAFGALRRLESPQAFASFVASIAVRTTHKRLRRHRIAVRLGLARRDELDWEDALAPDCPPDVAAQLAEIYRAIDAFPPKERVAFLLRRVEGMSLEEVATATGESLATVKRRIASAEARLTALREAR
jgi:RNA polymerase sigma-70 factor (ECF subfamily)